MSLLIDFDATQTVETVESARKGREMDSDVRETYIALADRIAASSGKWFTMPVAAWPDKFPTLEYEGKVTGPHNAAQAMKTLDGSAVHTSRGKLNVRCPQGTIAFRFTPNKAANKA